MCALDTSAWMQGPFGSLIAEFLFHGAAHGKFLSRTKTTITTTSLPKVQVCQDLQNYINVIPKDPTEMTKHMIKCHTIISNHVTPPSTPVQLFATVFTIFFSPDYSPKIKMRNPQGLRLSQYSSPFQL